MKLLFVTRLERAKLAVSALTKYAVLGNQLGHEVAVFGEPRADFPMVPHTRDITRFDFVVFIIYETWDFPHLPYLAQLLDGIPRERRVIIDCTGTFNETITIEHDSNHMQKLDGHQGWEWVEGFEAVASRILQPTLAPLRKDVTSFLLFGFDSSAVCRPYGSPQEAARAWNGHNGTTKSYGAVYVGHNWHRWHQVRRFIESIEPLKDRLGKICLRGWAWDQRPDWAVEQDFRGVDLDAEFLRRMSVETGETIPFNEVVEFQGKALFCPVIHRPLFNRLGLVTNRTFETFCSDTVPLLLLPDTFVRSIYGTDALPLASGSDLIGRLEDMLRRPEVYWDAVLKTRAHLAAHHSYEQRFRELLEILENQQAASTSPKAANLM